MPTHVLTAAVILVSAVAPVAQAQSQSQPPPALEVAFERLEAPAVRVTIRCAGEPDGATTFSLSEEWGGIPGAGREIHGISAADGSGLTLAIEPAGAHQWTVSHAPLEPLTLVYELRPEIREALAPGHNDYRNVVRDDLFHAIGNHALVLPEGIEGPVDVSVRWAGFPGWTIATSLGADASQSASLSIDEFRSCFFIAGRPGVLRLAALPLQGNTVAAAIIDADWGFTDERFLDLVMEVVAAEREFFGDHTDPWFLVALTPNGARAGARDFSFGGTGLTNCFALYCNTGLDLSPGAEHAERIYHLLAHEYFHTWNGRKIRIDAPEGAAYWFSEGFTEFYTRRLLRRAGLWSDAQWLESLNESIAGYDGNPKHTIPNDRIVADFWNDREVSDVPYRRGDLLALALDEAIIERAGGGEGLDGLMRDLHRRSAAGEPPLTPDQLFALVASSAGEEFSVQFRECVEDGAEAPLPETIEGGTLVLASGQMRQSDDGFDVASSRASGVVTGVREHTGAHDAGLRDGQRLVSAERLPPVAGPARLKVVTLAADASELTTTFEAVSEPKPVRRYAPRNQ